MGLRAARRVPPVDSASASVQVTAEAHARLVNRVGRSSAATFVAVALKATRDRRSVLVVETSARALARTLGIAKDTAAAELGWLVEHGYLRRLAQPRTAGRFAPARYVVRLPSGFSLTPVTTPCPANGDTTPGEASPARAGGGAASRERRGAGRPGGRAGDDAQLGLFPAASHAETTRPR